MATRTFANISQYGNVNRNRLSPLDALIQGASQGIELSRLPQKLQDEELARQLNNALVTEKLNNLRNPNQALARRLEEELTLKGALNPDLGIQRAPVGLVGETIGNPQAVDQTALTLEQALQGNPAMSIPSAAPKLPETPVSAFGIQTGLNVDPNVPLETESRKLENQIAAYNARPYNQIITRDGYAIDPRKGTGSNIVIEDQNLSEQRRLQAEADAKAKTDAAQALVDTRGTQAADRLKQTQGFTAEQNKLNRENQITLAEKRAAAKSGGGSEAANSSYIQEGITRNLQSIDDLRNRVGLDTVGVGSLLRYIPATDARNFEADLNTLKANLAFGELAAMRAASKTGGALGAISNKELTLLESSVAALDTGQSPDNFRKNLDNIEASINRWKEAVEKNSPSKSTSSTSPVKVNSKSERDALPVGTVYVSPSGAISTR